MCYFITIIVPENFLKEKTVKTPRGLELTPMENPSIQKRILKNEVQLALTSFRDEGEIYWNLLMAATLVVSLPIYVVFFFAQKHFVKGLLAGSVKS